MTLSETIEQLTGQSQTGKVCRHKKDSNLLVISFPYSKDAVEKVHSIEGRRWWPDFKIWTVPVDSLLQLRKAFPNFEYEPGLANELPASVEATIQLDGHISGLVTRPYTFQMEGIRFLMDHPKCLLADQMGLGKTLQVIATILLRKQKQVLILCPASLKYNWAEEFAKHAPGLRVAVVAGSKGERKAIWASAGIVIANYELLLHDWEELSKVRWEAVIADEVSKVKNWRAKQTKRIKQLQAAIKIGMTGTPVENRLEELASIMEFINKAVLGSGYSFVQKYCIKDKWGSIIGYTGIEEIKTKLAPHRIRRLKSEVLKQLPPKIYQDYPIELDEMERAAYNELESGFAEWLVEMDKEPNLINVLAQFTRFRQCVDSLEIISKQTNSSKLEALHEILENLNGDKTIIFTSFDEMAQILMRELASYNPVLIAGRVKPEDRQAAVNQFQTDPAVKLIISTDAGAYGLTMTAASVVIHYDQAWNPARMHQREDRAHRIGQDKNLLVITLVARKTIDGYMQKLLHEKERLIADVVGDDDLHMLKAVCTNREELLRMVRGE